VKTIIAQEMSLSLLSSAPVGFAAPLPAVRPVAQPRPLTMSAADGMEGAAHETGFTTWDPLGLADLGSPATLAFFRHAELKHCRVAMAAFTGWLVAVSGVHFPGLCSFSEGISFEDISQLTPMEQWGAVPALGKAQILLAIGIIEHQSEWKIKPHYMAAGGKPGDLKGLKSFWDPIGSRRRRPRLTCPRRLTLHPGCASRPHLENGREEARAAAPVRDQKRAARHDWHRLGLDREQHARSDPAADCLPRRTLACAPLLVAVWRARGLAAARVRVIVADVPSAARPRWVGRRPPSRAPDSTCLSSRVA